jgi:hypothetical protein
MVSNDSLPCGDREEAMMCRCLVLCVGDTTSQFVWTLLSRTWGRPRDSTGARASPWMHARRCGVNFEYRRPLGRGWGIAERG